VLGKLAAIAAAVLLLAGVGLMGWMWYSSLLPGSYSVMDYGDPDYGGGPVPPGGHHAGGRSIASLHGPAGPPDVRYRLVARNATVRLASGRTIDALTFNGRSPGPELRVTQGDLVEVTLLNKDVEQGVTIHWHGVDVPNAEDGVAGVTQDAVLPGEHYTYRFRVDQVGTFWYHSHQVSAKEVRRGLFGAFVIEPRSPPADVLEIALIAHTFDGIPTLDADDGLQRRAVRPGTRVRLRLIDSDSSQQRFTLGGTAFRVVAIDGTDVHEPARLVNRTLVVGAGGRMDVVFTMPAGPVRVSLDGTNAGVAFSPDGKATPAAPAAGPEFDPAVYGSPRPTPFGTASSFDRRFELTITRKPAFFDGRPGRQWAINGEVFPNVPVFVVEAGDLVEVTITNDTKAVHPMHLHGHHVLVLSRDGKPVAGSPWWVDTLNVQPGERYVVGFRADNPGVWMDHCHNLGHAAAGLTMHIAYSNATTPFRVGDVRHNKPE
jgi:FtsP/CotA-like multicopper oxidase with cupredoxin domain